MIGILLGIMKGTLIVCVMIFILFLMSRAINAHEVTRINEYDQRLISNAHTHRSTAIEDMILINMADNHTYSSRVPPSDDGCKDLNKSLQAIKDDLDKAKAAHPEYADIHTPAYEAIEEAWCK